MCLSGRRLIYIIHFHAWPWDSNARLSSSMGTKHFVRWKLGLRQRKSCLASFCLKNHWVKKWYFFRIRNNAPSFPLRNLKYSTLFQKSIFGPKIFSELSYHRKVFFFGQKLDFLDSAIMVWKPLLIMYMESLSELWGSFLSRNFGENQGTRSDRLHMWTIRAQLHQHHAIIFSVTL